MRDITVTIAKGAVGAGSALFTLTTIHTIAAVVGLAVTCGALVSVCLDIDKKLAERRQRKLEREIKHRR